ncbi:hypothetical protein JCM17961_28240 [Endothiovibrio diazotrophicus]
MGQVASGLDGHFHLADTTQDPATGVVSGSDGVNRLVLRPLAVGEAAPGEAPGVWAGDGGALRLVTGSGEAIELVPAVEQPQRLDDGLRAAGLAAYEVREGGRFATAGGGVEYHFQPGLAIAPADDAASEGISVVPREGLPGLYRVAFVYRDGDQRLSQALWPTPAEWSPLGDWLEALPGIGQVVLDGEGVLTVELDGVRLRGVFDYGVEGGGSGGALTLEEAGDVNGDGIPDYRIRYPGGGSQLLFMVGGE